MRMTRDEAKRRFPERPDPAPAELAGQWVAWNTDRNKIVAHGSKLEDVRADAIAAGCREPLMQRILGTPFVG
jgi:hypothetical protein